MRDWCPFGRHQLNLAPLLRALRYGGFHTLIVGVVLARCARPRASNQVLLDLVGVFSSLWSEVGGS